MASSAPKPVVVLIPGAWHTTESFTPLITSLSLASYPCIALSSPSAGAHPSHASFEADVASIRKTVTSLVEAGKEVVLVMHSFGSVIGSEALAVGTLSRAARKEAGLDGGVVRLVYIGILLPEEGKTMFETFMAVVASPDLDPDFPREENQDYHVMAEDGTSTITDGATRFYNHLPAEEAAYWGSRMTSCSLGTLMSPLTFEAWHHFPSAYIACLQDRSIPLKQVREIVKRANIELVLEIDAGHCAYVGKEEEVGAFIRKAAGEVL